MGTTYGMDPHNRMLTLDGFPSHKLPIPPCALGLWKPGMLSSQPLQQFLDWFAQPLVSSSLADPRRIASRFWHVQQRQDSDARCLVLVGYIAVISCSCEFGGPSLSAVLIVGTEIDVMELDCVLYVSTNGMDV
jgi:hypothetical protein